MILHIARRDQWQQAQEIGSYRGDTLDSEGFIHCSKFDQISKVATERFRGRDDLVLLAIDPDRVQAEIVQENLEGGSDLFPHVYGPLNLDAITDFEKLVPGTDGLFSETFQVFWQRVMRKRPSAIIAPKPGQESVWDYPRPPELETVGQSIRVEFADVVIAESLNAFRVIETASPPVYYIPAADVNVEYMNPSSHQTFCEWKGTATYYSIAVGEREVDAAAWSYSKPSQAFAEIRGYFAFNAKRVDACFVGDERVTPQPGEYYGGWITSTVVGPFKGEPGSESW